MRFANPSFLLILIPVAFLIWLEIAHRKRKNAAISFPGIENLTKYTNSLAARLHNLPIILKYLALALLIIAFARPQAGKKTEEVSNRGIDIMLVLDTSTSMQALDFEPDNRLEAAKKVARDFVKGRLNDRLGLVVFAGLAYTQCPLTIDHDAVLNLLDQITIGMTQVDGTAVGSAIATAANRLKDSTGKSRVMILLTDGRNNMGEIDPITASEAAQALDIKIYTIGAGKPGGALYPVDDPFLGRRYVKIPEQELDEETLSKIASITGGRYFRATDINSLHDIFKQINEMEKTEIKTLKYTNYTELFGYFLWPAFLLLLIQVLLANTWLKVSP
jgi:Ca-activated chloride channel homolog